MTMKPYQTILLATDFSQHAERTAARAQDIASRYGAALQVLHVVEEVVLYN
ncbi:MAG TPA: universal stress protein, partial [Gammaproteobacteria bacterium]|nr:universal stress protein [Gammaproteobacteria bacterium]